MQGWCRQPNDVGSNSWQDSTVTELSIATTAAQYVDGDDDGDGDCGGDGDDDGDGGWWWWWMRMVMITLEKMLVDDYGDDGGW